MHLVILYTAKTYIQSLLRAFEMKFQVGVTDHVRLSMTFIEKIKIHCDLQCVVCMGITTD